MKRIHQALLIALLAFFLRTYLAYTGPVEYDEQVYPENIVNLNLALRQGSWNQILDSTLIYEHPQFFKLVYAAALFTSRPILNYVHINAGDPISSVPYWPKLFSLRLVSVFFGAAAVFLLSLVHPLAGIFLAIDTLAIKYTSVIYLDSLPAFASLAALLAALKALETYQKRARRWGVWLALSALALGMAAASKYMYAVVGLAIVAALLWQGWKQKLPVLLGLAAWGGLSLAFFFVLDPVLWHAPLARLNESILFNVNYSTGDHVASVGYPFWQPIQWLLLSIPQQPFQREAAFFSGPGDYFILADSLIFGLAVLGLPALFGKNKPMFLWLAIGLSFLLAWGTKWPQYTLLILAPFCLSAACAVDFLRAHLPAAQLKIGQWQQKLRRAGK